MDQRRSIAGGREISRSTPTTKIGGLRLFLSAARRGRLTFSSHLSLVPCEVTLAAKIETTWVTFVRNNRWLVDMTTPLSDATTERLTRLFVVDDLREAKTLLEEDCGSRITEYSVLLERVRFAVLKMSLGTIEGLVDAITLAQTDWRDALVAAGFADDPELHHAWWPGDDGN